MKRLTMIFLMIFLAVPGYAERHRLGSESSSSRQKVASSGLKLRSLRKVGVGIQAQGALGLVGSQLELNFFQDVSTSLGYGMGTGYQTFNFQVKKYMGSGSLLPFVSAGYSRWFTSKKTNQNYSETNPLFLSEKFLSEAEKNNGFAENIIYPGIGVQYLQSTGSWAGSSIYAEILMLIDVDDFVSQAVGSFGYMYYF